MEKWQIKIILTIIGLSYLLFWHYHVMVIETKEAVIETKEAVIETKEAVIEQVNIVCDNYEKDRKLLYDLNKELRDEMWDIYKKRNVTFHLPPTIPIENVSHYT